MGDAEQPGSLAHKEWGHEGTKIQLPCSPWWQIQIKIFCFSGVQFSEENQNCPWKTDTVHGQMCFVKNLVFCLKAILKENFPPALVAAVSDIRDSGLGHIVRNQPEGSVILEMLQINSFQSEHHIVFPGKA